MKKHILVAMVIALGFVVAPTYGIQVANETKKSLSIRMKIKFINTTTGQEGKGSFVATLDAGTSINTEDILNGFRVRTYTNDEANRNNKVTNKKKLKKNGNLQYFFYNSPLKGADERDVQLEVRKIKSLNTTLKDFRTIAATDKFNKGKGEYENERVAFDSTKATKFVFTETDNGIVVIVE